MSILHITDVHSNTSHFKDIGNKDTFELVILSGDITHFGDNESMIGIIRSFKEMFKSKILAVSGNCDSKFSAEALDQEGVSVQNKVVQFARYQVCGTGGSLNCPGTTPNEYTEKEYNQILKRLEPLIVPDKPLILVTHQPPYKTMNDKVMLGFHVGSKSVRAFIERQKPILCFTGHIHEGVGVDFIGKCPIINPGPFKSGKYAIVDRIGKNSPQIRLFN